MCIMVTAAACGSSPNTPSPPVTRPIESGVALPAPTLLAPAQGSTQDVRPFLTVKSAEVGSAILGYEFQVSRNPSFEPAEATSSVVSTRDATTSTKLTTDLATDTVYYWRARAKTGYNPGIAGPYSSTWSFRTRAVALQAPAAVNPPNGSPQPQRPTLTVSNAARIGPSGPIVYEFEIFTESPPDYRWRPVAASGAVSEGMNTTSFTPPELAADMKFLWRARAIDTLTGAMSSDSTISTFVTHGPDAHIQTLVLHVVDTCLTSGGYPRAFMFDGTLTGSGNASHFTLSQKAADPSSVWDRGPNTGDLRVDITRTGDQISGVFTSDRSRDRTGYWVSVSGTDSLTLLGGGPGPAPFRGTVAADGRMLATFDGSLYVLHHTFGMAASCAAAGFSWTLAP
jgi:hypothetical protein